MPSSALFAALLVGARAALPSPMVMPWLCLEVCGDSASAIEKDVLQITSAPAPYSGLLNVASFENFNLGANSTLIKHNLTNVATRIRAAGAMTLAMVSSYPYPPEFLTWMRQVFADPQPFIDACIAAAADEQLSGFNVRRAKFSPPPFTCNNSSSYLHPSLPIPCHARLIGSRHHQISRRRPTPLPTRASSTRWPRRCTPTACSSPSTLPRGQRYGT